MLPLTVYTPFWSAEDTLVQERANRQHVLSASLPDG